MAGRWQRFKQRMIIVGPPLLLLVVGAVVYIAVVRLSEPEVQVIKAIPDQSNKTATEASSSANPSTIETKVDKPSQATLDAWQEAVDEGRDTWRLDPLEVAKRSGAAYGFAASDTMVSQSSASASRNEFIVRATHKGQDYVLTLTQPKVKGQKGVWMIESIETD